MKGQEIVQQTAQQAHRVAEVTEPVWYSMEWWQIIVGGIVAVATSYFSYRKMKVSKKE